MVKLCLLQHTGEEFLGLLKDHFESRVIRFAYSRPFVAGGNLPASIRGFDGLVLLGAGPYGIVNGRLLPSLTAKLQLTAAFLEAGLPVIGIGLGSALPA